MVKFEIVEYMKLQLMSTECEELKGIKGEGAVRVSERGKKNFIICWQSLRVKRL